jgi:glycosyltransferase involved in cell wall biosynthesis
LRCAIVHYWLLGMRGGERVLDALCELLPDADIFTLFYEPERVSPVIRKHRVFPSFLNPLSRFHRHTLPLAPFALESFDLRPYDLVISSESGPAKGVIVSSHARHVCYCHSPMRYLWDLYPAYLHEWSAGKGKKVLLSALSNYLRIWDTATAGRVDEFVANSANVQRRIWRAYRRESEVIYPPVDTARFSHANAEDYFLVVSALVEYKRISDAVTCFSRAGRKLKVVGEGPQYRALKNAAASNVEFCGRVTDDELATLYSRCRAVVMPGEEDFGIVPIEALASGKPVIALARGGVLETVPRSNPCAGILYPEEGPEALERAVAEFEQIENEFNPGALQRAALRFCKPKFMADMAEFLGRGQTESMRQASASA